MINAGFHHLLIGSTISSIRKNENLNLAQNRVLEALTPDALIIVRSDEKIPIYLVEKSELYGVLLWRIIQKL